MRHWKVFVLAAAVASAGCWTSAGDGEQMRRDIDSLQASLRAQRESNAAEQERIKAESTQKAKELREAMDALNRAARKSGADLAVDLERAQNDVAQLRGQLEVLQHRQDELESKQVERDRKVAETAAALEQRKKQIDAAEHHTKKGAIYALAVKKLDAGETGRARELLTDFLARFRSDPLAANAQYWLGETYYAERRYKDAIVEFQRVLKERKASEKVPDALLKIGLSFQASGDCAKARLFFDEVTASHRGTEAARIARLKAAECKKGKKGQ
ncbi:MAG: tol-pal system protein YbgF [Myxococcales bacterium]